MIPNFYYQSFGFTSSRRQSGFTLIEMMVALVLGLIVVLGASQLFLTSSQSFRSIENINRRQEVVSYVSNVIGYEMRMAQTDSGPIDVDTGNIGVEGSRLLMVFSGDKYKPYCPAGTSEMQSVEYYLTGSVLKLSPKCDGTTVEPAIEVISGISDINFKANKVNGDDVYVDVVLTLDDGESSLLSSVIAIRFARHDSKIFTDT